MFVLLFAYVFGGAIPTPGHSYIDFLIPGILVQTMAFGGFVTAMGIAEDLRKGLVDRFRSLPMSRSAVLAGRTLSDIATNGISITVMLIVGVIIGFGFEAPFLHVVAGILLLLLFGYAFSWVFAFIGLTSSSPEAAQSLGFILIFPLTFVSSAFVPPETMPGALQWFAGMEPLLDHRQRDPRPLHRRPGRQHRLGRRRLVPRHRRRLRPPRRDEIQTRRRPLNFVPENFQSGTVPPPTRALFSPRFGGWPR